MEHLGFQSTEFCKILCLNMFRKSIKEMQVSFKSEYFTVLYMKKTIHFNHISLRSLRIRNVLYKSGTENQNTILHSITFLRIYCRLSHNVEEFWTARQAQITI